LVGYTCANVENKNIPCLPIPKGFYHIPHGQTFFLGLIRVMIMGRIVVVVFENTRGRKETFFVVEKPGRFRPCRKPEPGYEGHSDSEDAFYNE
jgi:hypothetical protein